MHGERRGRAAPTRIYLSGARGGEHRKKAGISTNEIAGRVVFYSVKAWPASCQLSGLTGHVADIANAALMDPKAISGRHFR